MADSPAAPGLALIVYEPGKLATILDRIPWLGLYLRWTGVSVGHQRMVTSLLHASKYLNVGILACLETSNAADFLDYQPFNMSLNTVDYLAIQSGRQFHVIMNRRGAKGIIEL